MRRFSGAATAALRKKATDQSNQSAEVFKQFEERQRQHQRLLGDEQGKTADQYKPALQMLKLKDSASSALLASLPEHDARRGTGQAAGTHARQAVSEPQQQQQYAASNATQQSSSPIHPNPTIHQPAHASSTEGSTATQEGGVTHPASASSLLSVAWSAVTQVYNHTLQMVFAPRSRPQNVAPQPEEQAQPLQSSQAQGTLLEQPSHGAATAGTAGVQVREATSKQLAHQQVVVVLDDPVHAHILPVAAPLWMTCQQAYPSTSLGQVSPAAQPQAEVVSHDDASLAQASAVQQASQPAVELEPEARRQVLESLVSAMGQLSPLTQRRASTQLLSLATSTLQHQLAPDEADSLIYIQSKVTRKVRSAQVRPEQVMSLISRRVSEAAASSSSPQSMSRRLLEAMHGLQGKQRLGRGVTQQQQQLQQQTREQQAQAVQPLPVAADHGQARLLQVQQEIKALQAELQSQMRALSQPPPAPSAGASMDTLSGGDQQQPSTQFEQALERLRPVWELQGRIRALTREREALLAPLEPKAPSMNAAQAHPQQQAAGSKRKAREGDDDSMAAQPPIATLDQQVYDVLGALSPSFKDSSSGGALRRKRGTRQEQEAGDVQSSSSSSSGFWQSGSVSSAFSNVRWAMAKLSAPSNAAAAAEAASMASWVQQLQSQLAPTSLVSASLSSVDHSAEASPEAPASVVGTHASPAEQMSSSRSLFGRQQSSQPVVIAENISVRRLAALLGASTSALEVFLSDQVGEAPGSLEDPVSREAAELAALEWGVPAAVTSAPAAAAAPHFPAMPRPAVVTIMGHVDHGKTSLLDALRSTNVVAGEAGGITQHIGAFEVSVEGAGITFIDTPGHSAFAAMRARGAAVTDIVVLVVAADDGVMPQTLEALAHARSSGCPIVVALTKCDLPQARPDIVKAALAAQGLELEEHGGDVQVVHTSAHTGLGLPELKDAIAIQAELMSLAAPSQGPATATVVETSMGRSGPQATVIVRRGRLRVGDALLVGTEYGKVRSLHKSDRTPYGPQGVGPGQHALVTGLRGMPQAGDDMTVVASEDRARKVSSARKDRADEFRRMRLMSALHSQRSKETDQGAAHRVDSRRLASLAKRKQSTAAQLAEMSAKHRAATGAQKPNAQVEPASSAAAAAASQDSPSPSPVAGPQEEVRLVVKADVQGSVEAVVQLVQQISSPSVNIKVIHAGVGPLALADINLAVAAGAHLVVFNLGSTGISPHASNRADIEAGLKLACTAGLRLLSHNIVYHLMDQIKGLAEGAAPYQEVEEVVGTATVLATFPLSLPKSKLAGLAGLEGGPKIAGVRVMEGQLKRTASFVRVLRDGKEVYRAPLTSLKRHKLAVDVVGKATECGVVLDEGRVSDFQPGDLLECVEVVQRRVSGGQLK